MDEKGKGTTEVVEPTNTVETPANAEETPTDVVEEIINTVPEDCVEPIEPEKMYSDMLIICNKCGSTQTIGKGIDGNAVQFTITHDEKSFLQINCDKCEGSLKLRIVKGEAPVNKEDEKPSEILVNEDVPQENKQEESL